MRPVVLLVLSLVAAGCVSVPDPAVDPASAAASGAADPFHGLGDPLIVDHDHSDLAAHALSTPSMSELAHASFAELGAGIVSFGEIDLLGEDHLVLAGFVGGGFLIADVADPAAPRGVSFTPDPGMQGDVKASESGNFVFVGRQVGQWQGVQAYNVALRERPAPAGFYPIVGVSPFRGGCHMLAVHAGHLYCAPNDNTVRILQIVETPGAVALIPAGVYSPLGAPPAPLVAGEAQNGELTHDMTVQDDPITGKPVMYVSFWNYGLRVVDVSDPANPTELGAWLGEGVEERGTYLGAIHTAMGGLVGGRRVVAVVPEYADVPSVTLIDATDYAAMTALGVWAPKTAEEMEGNTARFSTHNFQLVGEKLYLAMYHGGVWVFDLAGLGDPVPVGYFVPSGSRGALPAVPTPFTGGPSVWDVVVKDGVILATDMSSGLYALQHERDVGATGLTSFA